MEEGVNSPQLGETRNFAGVIFLHGSANLRRSDFDNLSLFQSRKQLSVNTEHQLKLKLACAVSTKEYEIKKKMVQEQ